MELSMAEITLIQIACRAMMENGIHQKDRIAYESLLKRLTIVIKGKRLSIDLIGSKDEELTVMIPPKCLNLGGRSDE